MEHVTSIPRPGKASGDSGAALTRSPWILNRWRDLFLYVGTPFLLLPVFALARSQWSAQNIFNFVAAFGAMGHHLPGMIRAYGDRALFERFRWRFILAPVLVVAISVGSYWWDIKGIVLLVLVWAVWHGMMQTYGFCRIYDAKVGAFKAADRRLDFAACAIWFSAGLLLSPSRLTDILETYYASGGPFIAPAWMRVLQQGILFAAIAVSVLFLINFARQWRQEKRPSPVKLALLITSIGFWWFCNNVANILAGIALFEVFHDVQYLSLVWIYNRNRVEKDRSIRGFMRFVFRRSGSLVGLYIGVVFAYGSLAYFNTLLQAGAVQHVLAGVVTASALLHFYYDGFIWKVREQSTRQSLAIGGGSTEIAQRGLLPGWVLHGSKWALAFAFPLAVLWIAQGRGLASEASRAGWVVADLPSGARQHLKYAIALQKSGRTEEAVAHYQIALGYDPDDAITHYDLAGILTVQSRMNEAAEHFGTALRLEPNDGEYHYDYARTLERLNRNEEAERHYEAAVRFKPDSSPFHFGYATYLTKMNRPKDAIAQYHETLRLNPEHIGAHVGIGNALYAGGSVEEAKSHYLEAIRLNPKQADIHDNLGQIYIRLGKIPDAIAQYQEALRLNPALEIAAEHLRLARSNGNSLQTHSPR
jgi:tetratricopeptide (TPR) repeat protein